MRTLPCRVEVDGSSVVHAWLRDLQAAQLEQREHGSVSLVELQGWSEVPAGTPLFETLFVYENYPTVRQPEDAKRLRVRLRGGSESTNYALSLLCGEVRGELYCRLMYDRSWLEVSTVGRIAGHLVRLLEDVASDPSRRVSELSLLSEAERHQLLVEWDAKAAAYPDDKCIHELFEAQVERTPDAVAVVFDEDSLTYGQLNQRANRLAHTLREMGVGVEDLVGLCVERSPELVVGLLGILKAGGAYVPLDPQYPRQRLGFMLEDSGVSVLVTQASLLETLPERPVDVLCLDRDAAVIDRVRSTNPRPVATTANLAYAIYTSGSTGRPKAALLTHRGLCSLSEEQRRAFRVEPTSRVLQFSSISFDAATFEIVMALTHGAALFLATRETLLPGPDLHRFLGRHAITIVTLPPSGLGALPVEPLPDLSTITVAGEACSAELVSRWAPGRRFFNLYGPTETTIWSTMAELEATSGAPHIGRPIGNTRVHVLGDRLDLVPVGVPGELCIGGVGLGRGYHGRPDLTAERFVPDPLTTEPGERLYRTGDLARYRPDGAIEYLGRLDHQVKVRGYRIELGEIESVLVEHPEVRQAVVVAREDAPGARRLVAYVVAEDGGSPGHAELRAYLKEWLPAYMVPSLIGLLEALPRTPSGKVDRAALPAPSRLGTTTGYVGARTGTEEVLCSIWSELLGADRVGVHDDFFELGGHSLLATQLVSRIRRTLERELALREVFEHPTVAQLSARLAEVGSEMAIPPLTPVDRKRDLPLSFAQERLWFLDQLESGSAYHIPLSLRLRGALDEPSLRRSLEALIDRHETLRTSFALPEDGRPVQRVAEAIALPLRRIDLRSLGSGEREREARRVVEKEVRRAFDLSTGPLVRWLWVRLSEAEHVLVMTMHHIVSDGWSMGVLLREWTALYEACRRGEPSPLAEPAAQYGDYTVWQREWLRGEVLDSQLSYWRGQLADVPMLELPADRPRPAVQTFEGGLHAFAVGPEVSAGLRRLCREQGVTLAMVLVGAWQVLLGRYAGQDDVAVGMPIANRRHGELEELIGFFVNTLVLRTDLSGDPSFEAVVRRVKDASLSAYGHQDVPFEQVVEALNPKRALSHHPLFQVLFAMQNAPREVLRLGDVEVERFGFEGATTRFDLELHFTETGQDLIGQFIYNVALFDDATVERMAGHLERVLTGIAADPSRRVGDLPLMSEAERQRVVLDWNRTEVAYPVERCLPDLFESQADRTPGAPAVRFGEAGLTYGELEARSNRLGRLLRSVGIGPDVGVGICVERSLEMVVAVLGILKAGGAYVPLDPTYPADRLRYMLDSARVPVVLVHGATRGRVQVLLEDAPFEVPEVVCLDRDASRIEEWKPERLAKVGDPSHLAYVLFTSGSTGRPKGVAMPHGPLVNLMHWQLSESVVGPGSRTLQFAPLGFDVSCQELFSTLASGGELCVVSDDLRLDPQRLLEYLSKECVERIFVPFVALRQLAEVGVERDRVPSGLREVITAGEQLQVTPAVVEFFRRVGSSILVNQYGPTECHVVSSWTLSGDPGSWPSLPPIGRPIANARLYVLDGNRRPVPIGVPGELHIGGAALARGYLNDEPLTQERFVPDPFGADGTGRLYRTGDLARYVADGSIEYLGRTDRQVKLRGFRVELGEIESVLMAHAGVRQAVAMVRQDDPGRERLVAYVVSREEGASPSSSELRSYLIDRLPAYMVPSSFVALDALPLTPTGKVHRRALPAPSGDRIVGAEYLGPRNGTEDVLCSIWSELLGVARVGVHDDFFELGGHSLLATQLVSRIRRTLDRELALREIFERPTVGELASGLAESSSGVAIPALVREDRTGDLPLSFAQERLWFLDQLEAGSAYNMPMSLRLKGHLDVGALERALSEIVRRHETLRTSFSVIDGHPVQRISDPADTPLATIDLGDVETAARPAEIARRARDEAVGAFDLACGPLLRSQLMRLGDDDHVLLLTMHHIVSDGWSMGVLQRELTTLYEAFCRGEESPLADLEVQYADFTLWQRSWLEGESLGKQLTYWRRQLAGLAPLEVPTDRPRPAVQTHGGAVHDFVVPPDLRSRTAELCRQANVTPAMVLLATWQVLLSRYSGQQDVAVGAPIANRTQREVEPLIGFFVNTLVMRTDLSGDPRFEEVLRRVREVSLAAYEHQDVPFERVVEELNPQRDLSRHPLFQVMFAMQNAPREALRLGDLELGTVPPSSTATRFDMELHFFEHADRLVGRLVYNADLFEHSTIERMTGHLLRLLAGIAEDPSLRLSELPLLSESERHQVVTVWNDTATDYPSDRCVHELFEEQVERRPEAIAASCGEEQLTYGELNARSNRLAHHLRSLGVGPEVRVGLCVERSVEMVVGLLGILKAGGAYVPFASEYPPKGLAFMLEDARPSVVLTQGHLRSTLPTLEATVIDLNREWSSIARNPTDNVRSGTTAEDLAYVMYTSGSTGRPKGTAVVHRGVVRLVRSADYASLGPDEVFLQLAPISFDASTLELWGPLLNGGKMAIFPPGRPSLGELAKAIRGGEITSLWLTAALFHQMVDEELESLCGVRQLLAGGDVLSVPHVRRVLDVLPETARLVNGYGPTENTTFTCCHVMWSGSQIGETVPIGRPIANTRGYVLDRWLHPVPTGVTAELYAGGDGLARGYWDRPDLTAERFVPDPFASEPGQRLYRTGDLARYQPNGAIEFLGRLDRQVKVRGYRIELGEIESVLLEHPEVRKVVAVIREDPDRSSSPGRAVAYVVAEDDRSPSRAELRAFLIERVPSYMVPSAIVMLERLPVTASGKVDRQSLPAPQRSLSPTGYVAARNGTEEVLCSIWSELLVAERVGVHDNFFDLGGDSILSIQVVARARRAEIELTPRQIFQHQTIAELAEVAGAGVAMQTLQGPLTGVVPLLPVQRWLFEQDLAQPEHFNQALLFRLHKSVAAEDLDPVLEVILERHDALRGRFVEVEPAVWEQRIAEPGEEVPLTVMDPGGVQADERAAWIARHAHAVQSGFDLAEGSLFRAVWFGGGGDESDRLLLVAHHLVIDAVSWRVLLEDLERGLSQRQRGQPVELGAKTSSIRQWSERLIEYGGTQELRDAARYWQDPLWSESRPLPVDDASSANTAGSSSSVLMTLSEDKTRALLQDVPGAYHTQINDALLTAMWRALSDWTGSSRVALTLEGHGREDVFEGIDLSQTVGWFTSIFPVWLEVSGGWDPGEALRSIKEQLRSVPHRGLDYGVARYLSGDEALRASLSELPRPEVSFNYLGQFDDGSSGSSGESWLTPAPESTGSLQGPRNLRRHLLDVTGMVSGGKLGVRWIYSRNIHRRETIEGVASRFLDCLRELIDHGCSQEVSRYTPSDFPKAGLDQRGLDQIIERVSSTSSASEDDHA